MMRITAFQIDWGDIGAGGDTIDFGDGAADTIDFGDGVSTMSSAWNPM